MSSMGEGLSALEKAMSSWEASQRQAVSSLDEFRGKMFRKPKSAVDAYRQARSILCDDAGRSGMQASIDACMQAWRDSVFEGAKEVSSAVEKLMQSARLQGRHVVLFMSQMYTDELLADGFFRRVHAIDELMELDALRVFVGGSSDERVSLVILDDNYLIVGGPLWDVFVSEHLTGIARQADIICCESAYHILPNMLENHSGMLIYDFHGVAPEEEEQKGNKDIVPVIEDRECFGASHSDIILVVSNAMKMHILKKYPSCKAQFILMPIFDDPVLAACDCDLVDDAYVQHEVPVAVYAGGMQVWQMVDAMQDAIEAAGDTYAYKIFTPDIDSFWEMWSDRKRPEAIEVSTATPEQVVEEYAHCDYGFILRENLVVNKVACPTKLVEYCACGVVPIINTTDIGDFSARGMRAVHLEDFIRGILPDKDEYAAMVRNNKQLARDMASDYLEGRKTLEGLLDL